MRSLTLAVVAAVAAVSSGPSAANDAGQVRAVSTPPVKTWAPPRTQWGDPDISGNFTNLYEVGTPFERPDEFTGRQLGDVKGAELAAICAEAHGALHARRARQGAMGGDRGRPVDVDAVVDLCHAAHLPSDLAPGTSPFSWWPDRALPA
jgi:hypothetical protein